MAKQTKSQPKDSKAKKVQQKKTQPVTIPTNVTSKGIPKSLVRHYVEAKQKRINAMSNKSVK